MRTTAIVLLCMFAGIVPGYARDWIVTQGSLDEMIDTADKLVVYDIDGPDTTVVYSTEDKEDIRSLKTAMIIVPPREGTTWGSPCIKSPVIELYSGESVLGFIKDVHGDAIETSLWWSYAKVKDVPKYTAWFRNRGILLDYMEQYYEKRKKN